MNESVKITDNIIVNLPSLPQVEEFVEVHPAGTFYARLEPYLMFEAQTLASAQNLSLIGHQGPPFGLVMMTLAGDDGPDKYWLFSQWLKPDFQADSEFYRFMRRLLGARLPSNFGPDSQLSMDQLVGTFFELRIKRWLDTELWMHYQLVDGWPVLPTGMLKSQFPPFFGASYPQYLIEQNRIHSFSSHDDQEIACLPYWEWAESWG